MYKSQKRNAEVQKKSVVAQDTIYLKFTPKSKTVLYTDIENKCMDTKVGKGIGVNWQIGIDLFTLIYTIWRRKWQPTPVLLSGKSHGWRSLVGYIVHGVAKSWTQLSNFTQSYTLLCIKSLMRNHCIAQRTLLRALWWPKWEGNPKTRGYTYTYSWFTLLHSRN